jgi:hypothetical protein
MTSLDDKLSKWPEAWKPQAGDRLIGTVTEIEERDSDYSEESYPALLVEVEAGPDGEESQQDGEPVSPGTELVLYASQASIMWQVRRKKVAAGDKIAVKFLGLGEQSKPGMAQPKLYRLIVLERGGNEPPVAVSTASESSQDEDAIPFDRGSGHAA